MALITGTALSGALSTSLIFTTVDFERIFVQITNGAVAALTAFQVQGRADSAATFHTLVSAYTTMGGILIAAGNADGTASSLATLAQNASAWLVLQTKGIEEIKFAGTGDGAILTYYICGKS